MTVFKITNGSTRTKAFKVVGGTEDVLPGKTATIDVQGGLTAEFVRQQTALGVEFEEVKAEEQSERDILKAKADELGIEYPKNIPTGKLEELVTQASQPE